MKNQTRWVTFPAQKDAVLSFRTTLPALTGSESKAELCVSAIGIYAAFLGDTRVGKGVLTPGWTSYHTRVQYQKYDITESLTVDRELNLLLSCGWAVGYIWHADTDCFFADHPSLIAWLEITDRGRKRIRPLNADAWEVFSSGYSSEGIYHGETIDKTAVPRHLGKAKTDPGVKAKLIPQEGEWITEQEILAPRKILRTPKGETVIDFGQNLTGYVEVRVRASRGDRIVMHHAEVLDRDGNFYNKNLRRARNENVYICSGEDDVFKPLFCFQGFRYIRLSEFPAEHLADASFRAIVVHSEMKRTGSFVCGNEKINQLYHNVVWGQKSNYLDIPTDCPQRDERLGWTGDAQIFCRTAAINFDVSRFFRKWLADMAIDQGGDGGIPDRVPYCVPEENHSRRYSAAWGDVACIAPWEMYLVYGNKTDLRKNYPMMKKWVGYLRGAGPEEYLWLGGEHYGDWLAMDAGEDSYIGATSNDLIASAYYAYSVSLLIRAGRALGEDVSEYETLYRNVRAAFRSYFMENGFPKEEFPRTEPEGADRDAVRRGMTQTALVLILYFGLCDPGERPALADRLEQLIHENGDLMATGFVGTPYLLHVLSDAGKTDLAYQLLFEERSPSWLYSVNHGATTMWEHWNSIKEDGSFWSADMNSFNHYAYGAVYDWIFGVAVGIKPVSPAYRETSIAPHPDRRLGFADASIQTRNGTIRSAWYYRTDGIHYEVDVPDGVTVTLTLPSGKQYHLRAGKYQFIEG